MTRPDALKSVTGYIISNPSRLSNRSKVCWRSEPCRLLGRSPMRSSGQGVSSRRARESAPAWARTAAAAMLAESEHALAPAAAPGSGMQRRSYVLDQHNADQQPARTRGNPC